MTSGSLIGRSLAHYWRTNLAVVAGVATAVTVLAGALLVGDSVRGSLRDLVLQRLGRTDLLIASSGFFREQLADDMRRRDPAFAGSFDAAVPIITLQGMATEQESGRRSSRVVVYGVDDRFWTFHGLEPRGLGTRDVLLSPTLARELGAAHDSTVLLRVQRPSDIPLESLHGRKDDLGRTIRLTVRGELPAEQLGEFSVEPQQGDIRAAFLPLSRLQQELDLEERVNRVLVSAGPAASASSTEMTATLESYVRRFATLEDVGLHLRPVGQAGMFSLESPGTLIDGSAAETARAVAASYRMPHWPLFTYLVNTIRHGDREVPYSLVTGLELEMIAPDVRAEETSVPPIVLNEWAARDLAAGTGDRVRLEYYVWEDPGRLVARAADFFVAKVVPIAGLAADRSLAPEYPGITESPNLSDWDPPFPIDLKRIRPIDEEYWEQYRTTPKAFVPVHVAQALWQSRYGVLTSVRFDPSDDGPLLDEVAQRLRAGIDPLASAFAVRDVRADNLAASRGATDFGEYFVYFSFFLVVSAVLLAALFFKLTVEQRGREVGLLRAVGYSPARVRRLFAAEALLLSAVGSAIGVAGALGYGYLIMTGLRTWWVDAVGTTALTLHVSGASLLIGAAGGIIAALVCIWWTLRTLSRVSERSLLAGEVAGEQVSVKATKVAVKLGFLTAVAFLAIGVLLAAAGAAGWIAPFGAFFGAGGALLLACLFALGAWLRRPPRTLLAGHGWWTMSRLGFRNSTYRPARSVLSVAVVASATFILISVDAFRRDGHADPSDRRSGTGGYALLVETLLPLVHDPGSAEGRDLIGLSDTEAVVTPLRVLPGDDASCLNLYVPQQPKIAAVSRSFVRERRFSFGGALDRSDEEAANPWLLLERELDDGAVPVIADANSMTYVLHRRLGDDIVITRGGRNVRLRLVAALSDSVFQSELLMAEEQFRRLFPDESGYRMLLVDAPADRVAEVSAAIEERLADFGADAVATGDRLAEFHRVENTYLSTFQTLGGLGLLVGTIGLGAVLLRNVLERRRELALLGAVGYGRRRLFAIVIAESALLLVCGLAAGVACALVAVAPAALERGGRLPTGAGAWLLLFAVFATGIVSSVVATRAALHARLLEALRAE